MSNSAIDDLLPSITDGTDATRALGRRIAGTLSPGSILALLGNLGAGKTELVRGIVEGLGVDSGFVTSPTFTVVNEYRGESLTIYHVDAYRLRSDREAAELGLEDLVYSQEAVCLVEWPERIARLLPPETIWIELLHEGLNRRRIRLGNPPGGPS